MANVEQLKAAFQKFDIDGNGYISKQEFVDAMTRCENLPTRQWLARVSPARLALMRERRPGVPGTPPIARAYLRASCPPRAATHDPQLAMGATPCRRMPRRRCSSGTTRTATAR